MPFPSLALTSAPFARSSSVISLWPQVAAASIVQSLPVLVFIFFVQRYLVRGLTFGAVKG